MEADLVAETTTTKETVSDDWLITTKSTFRNRSDLYTIPCFCVKELVDLESNCLTAKIQTIYYRKAKDKFKIHSARDFQELLGKDIFIIRRKRQAWMQD